MHAHTQSASDQAVDPAGLAEEVHACTVGVQAETRSTDGETRQQILKVLLKSQALSAVEIGAQLDLSPTGIRRHLDILLQEGEIEPASRPSGRETRRGRPAKCFQLTDAGRARFGHHYDDLATQALLMLQETGGEEAVTAFANQRAQAIMGELEGVDFSDIEAAAAAVVAAFDRSGYQATMQQAGTGIQICQHHCPIEHVAARFPQICAAEQAAIAAVLGKHVQPLATIADGQTICTTNIPLPFSGTFRGPPPGEAASGDTAMGNGTQKPAANINPNQHP
ncbi:MAG: transcriptional regulator [Corynebacterium sp.]|nr:transcriptional regulator [Corynebacterium sp.]